VGSVNCIIEDTHCRQKETPTGFGLPVDPFTRQGGGLAGAGLAANEQSVRKKTGKRVPGTRAKVVPKVVVARGENMNLKMALSIYRDKGPASARGEAMPTTASQATGVVHLHLTPVESSALLKAWTVRYISKADFFKALELVETRLKEEGFI